ncbi:MAG: hypothetical protein V4760_04670 [Bdellovibrionota bacterium]
MEWLIRTKMVVSIIFQEILESPLYLLVTTSVAFFCSIAVFSGIYYFLHRYHLASVEMYRNQATYGGRTPLPAFQISDILRKRLEVRAKNDLRLINFRAALTNVKWQNFSRDRSMLRQFPGEAEQWDDFRDRMVTGLSPMEMVESKFSEYGLVTVSVTSYRDNSFDQIFPLMVMGEYFEAKSLKEMHDRIMSGPLLPDEAQLLSELRIAASEIRVSILENSKPRELWQIGAQLKNVADKTVASAAKKNRLREILYGEVLSTLSPPTSQLEFNFQTMPMEPEFLDFVWLSSTVGTSNIPSELTPLTNDARLVMWLQLMLSYFILALLVAALVKMIGLA